MDTQELFGHLGYDERSESFLTPRRFAEVPEHTHVFQRAERFGLKGVYLLRRDPASGATASTPAVYVVEAPTEQEADEVHRKVWNQDIVPFVLVKLPRSLRLYAGFSYQKSNDTASQEHRGVLQAAIAFNEISSKLAAFRAQAIDNGTLWREWGRHVDPKARVDWQLLAHLKTLAEELHKLRLKRPVAHSLIGKYIYLRYLDERGLLSSRLDEWHIQREHIFGRRATVEALRYLIDRIERDWLNGSIFPIAFDGEEAPRSEHVRRVASAFLGDHPGTDQLHLDFKAYDFSCIPIETLSAIYEDFLELKGTSRESGAYYTPIPLVNFMIAELEEICPLKEGMRILDPSCGSGAFLVQCYRRLVAKTMSGPHKPVQSAERPELLRELLVHHIFGVDRDADACQVAAMSLQLTLLDSLDTEVLKARPDFKLPKLHESNVFRADFFDERSHWARSERDTRYDWVIGNPPWVKLGKAKLRPIDEPASRWMAGAGREQPETGEPRALRPIVGRQVAEAFAWKSLSHVSQSGAVGLLLPATTLFREESDFRSALVHQADLCSVANFANLRETLFPKRDRHVGKRPGTRKKNVGARHPAAALFYRPRSPGESSNRGDVLVYSPLAVNQEANRSVLKGKRQDTWSLVLNSSEVRSVPWAALSAGDALPLKTAMWGSPRDEHLLRTLKDRFNPLSSYAGQPRPGGPICHMHEGPQLRCFEELKQEDQKEPLERIPRVAGKLTPDLQALRGLGRIYAFPRGSLEKIPASHAYVRRGRGTVTLEVCEPPHIIISESHTFAVFSDDFLVVPNNYIGVSGPPQERERLVALSLYLSSDFAVYHDFFCSPNGGILGGRSKLSTLGSMPFPFNDVDASALKEWVELHQELVKTSSKTLAKKRKAKARGVQVDMFGGEGGGARDLSDLQQELNKKVSDLLGLTESERWLIHDLVNVRRHLMDGKMDPRALDFPPPPGIKGCLAGYADALREYLDEYVDARLGLSHRVNVVYDEHSKHAMAQIDLRARMNGEPSTLVEAADQQTRRALAKVSESQGQWLYFNRNLFVYRDDCAFILKPLHHVHWTRTQGMLDASEIIAQSILPGEAS
jgi:hypothetical protein